MNNEAMKEVLNDLFSHLERLETQSEAILQFLKREEAGHRQATCSLSGTGGKCQRVRWRAARVRIEHLLSPEHPEEEIKLGKQPELQEDSAESKRTESRDKENTESGDKLISASDDKDKSAPAHAAQARPADGKAVKPEEKSGFEQNNTEQAAQDKHEQKSDSDDLHHPTEVTAELPKQEGAEPAAQLSSKEKKSDREAA